MSHSYICRVEDCILFKGLYAVCIRGVNGKLLFASKPYRSRSQANARARQFVELVDGRIALED